MGLSIGETMNSEMGLIFDLFSLYKRQNGIDKGDDE